MRRTFMNFVRIILIISLLSISVLFLNCSDTPGGVTPPKYHTEENAGIWTDKIDSHTPVVTRIGGNKIEVRVTFSPTLNPLHYVETILLMKGENTIVAKKKFKPSVSIPVAVFTLPDSDEKYWVISKCNLHDMWRAEVK
jgi:desulfoferrodoxin (superoxide reductase-like protein)